MIDVIEDILDQDLLQVYEDIFHTHQEFPQESGITEIDLGVAKMQAYGLCPN